MRTVIGILIIIFFYLSCTEKKKNLYSTREVDSLITSIQIDYINRILDHKKITDNEILSYLDSIEHVSSMLGETPDSIAKIINILLGNKTSDFAVIPSSLTIGQVDNFSNLKDIGTYEVPLNIKINNAKRTIHLTDSSAKYILSIPESVFNKKLLNKYLFITNYEGYESAFTPPIVNRITFNKTADTVRIYTYDNYNGIITTFLRDKNTYKSINTYTEGDF